MLDDNEIKSDVAAAYEHGQQQVRILDHDGSTYFEPVIVIPEDHKIEELPTRKNARPLFLEQKIHFSEVSAFIDYVNNFKDDYTLILKDNEAHSITAIFDYHQAHVENEYENLPRHCDHVAVFYAKKTDEWLEWMRHNDESMTQINFAEFIEDHAKDFVTPDSGTMCEIASSIEAKTGVDFKQSVRMESGAASLRYEETIDGTAMGGTLEIPKYFEIALRPFEGCNRFAMKAMFRYKISGGSLHLRYKIIGFKDVLDETFKKFADDVEKLTEIEPMYGHLD